MAQRAVHGAFAALPISRLPHLIPNGVCQGRCAALQQQQSVSLRPSKRSPLVLAVIESEQRTSAQKHHRKVATRASNSSLDESDSEAGVDIKVLGGLAVAAGVVLLAGSGYVYRDSIKDAIQWFISVVDDFGSLAPVVYTFVYTVLELVIIPAVPLTMAAGVLFGVGPGVAVVSVASTAAAALAFLIARYAARDKVADLAKDNKKFAAIDRAIGKDSFKVVLLLRLSPLLPLSLSNYLYGLTSVDFVPYVFGSWLGMLPGTIAYVSAGSYGRKVLDGVQTGSGPHSWQLAIGGAVTILAVGYIGRIAKQALDEVDDELD